MNDTINTKEYRNLLITSLITGILSLAIFSYPELQSWPFTISDTARRILSIFNDYLGIMLGFILPIVAIVCGSIDLARIKKGIHRSKLFKGFDITGIVLGSIIFLTVSLFILGEIITPH